MFRLLGAIFAPVGGILLAVAGWTAVHKHHVIRDWPVVDATVTKSEVISYVDSDGDRMHRTELAFRYVVGGKTYQSPASSGYSSSSHSEMRKMADRFPVGSVRPIKYDPAEPDEITFDYGYSFGFFIVPVILGGMGLVFGLVGGIFLVVSFRARGLKCHKCGDSVDRGQKFCSNCAAPVSPFA